MVREPDSIVKPPKVFDTSALLIWLLVVEVLTLSLVGVTEPVTTADPETQVAMVMASVLVEFYPMAVSNAATKL